MTCKTIPRLTALRDGELSPEIAAEIEHHLAACPICAEAWSELAAVSALADAWGANAPDIADCVLDAIADNRPGHVLNEMRLLRAEMHTLRAELAALRRQLSPRVDSLPWMPPARSNDPRMENDPWNSIRS